MLANDVSIGTSRQIQRVMPCSGEDDRKERLAHDKRLKARLLKEVVMSTSEDVNAQAEELCDQAVDIYADGEYEEAIALYQRAVAIDPQCTDAFTGLAMCYQAKGDLDAAIAITRRYTEVAPDDILAFTNLSMFYQKKGMIKEAEAAGAEARRLDWKRQIQQGKK